MSSEMNNNGGIGPCGACKFLRRKCVKGCIFAPYFDAEQGAANFAAVHKVFGASNASKLLLRIPPNKRLDAVVTLCYEALARVRDPVYGCVGHLFTLQQQVVNLQAELAYIQAWISTMQRFPLPEAAESHSQTSSEMGSNNSNLSNMQFDDQLRQLQSHQYLLSTELSYNNNNNPFDQQVVDINEDLHAALARDFVCRYLPAGVRFKPPAPSSGQ
ncbi:LOB domain-containing protein 19 [Euphorbia lathyris]|uniref:LOB domain-containing protein 19 n=1 Tax=Euphorbia lathyris TaxID=212925 RepID=UPI00331428D2